MIAKPPGVRTFCFASARYELEFEGVIERDQQEAEAEAAAAEADED